VENVKGAQKFVGPAKWHYGSYYLWGDVPALMPTTLRERKTLDLPPLNSHDDPRRGRKDLGGSWCQKDTGVKCSGQKHGTEYAMTRGPVDGLKGPGGDWFKNGRQGQDACAEGIKQRGSGAEWSDGPLNERRLAKNTAAAHRAEMLPMLHLGKTTNSRKAASAQIAKIPFLLASHIARVFKP
jgi:hypothetical protein